jgi:hypothetical protein
MEGLDSFGAGLKFTAPGAHPFDDIKSVVLGVN